MERKGKRGNRGEARRDVDVVGYDGRQLDLRLSGRDQSNCRLAGDVSDRKSHTQGPPRKVSSSSSSSR